MKEYSIGEQNIIVDDIIVDGEIKKGYQMIRLSEGWCPHKCPWCREPKEALKEREYPIPKIIRNDNIEITDMNILASPHGLEKIRAFKDIRVDGKVVYPWLMCGIDYRFLTPEIAQALHESRFVNIHIAWDLRYSDQKRIKKAIVCLNKAGYPLKEISVFMVCNHPAISYKECCKKLNLCKYWGVKVNDCWYDGQSPPNVIPIAWNYFDIKEFRAAVRKHNQFVNYRIDPEL